MQCHVTMYSSVNSAQAQNKRKPGKVDMVLYAKIAPVSSSIV